MHRHGMIFGWLVAAGLLLAACNGSPGGNGGTDPTFDQDQFQGAVDGFGDGIVSMGARVERDAGFLALVALPPGAPVGFGGGAVPLNGGLASVAAAIVPLADQDLPRGVFEHDQSAIGDWTHVGPSDPPGDLVLRWAFDDEQGTTRDAELIVDWDAAGSTEEVRDAAGRTVEVPTAANVSLTVDGASAADVDVTFAWYAAAACPDGIAEPRHVMVDGSAGLDATLTFDEVRVDVSADTIATSGEITLAAGGDDAGLAWNVSSTGTVVRDACFLQEFRAEEGSVDASVFSEISGQRSSFGIAFAFDDLVLPDGADAYGSVDLRDGAVTVDGATAIAFAGTWNDADGDDVPGDEVTVTFSDGSSTTVEALIEGRLLTAAGIAQVLALFR